MFGHLYSPLVDLVFKVFHSKLKNRYSEGYDERCGIVPEEKLKLLKNKRPLWIHCVSVGEVQAAVPLILSARKNGYTDPILLSTTTITGREMAYRMAEGLFDLHIYYPWDKKEFVRRALDSINPWCFVATETELWPNMLSELKKRGIPSFASNCRISDRTWKKLSSTIGGMYGREMYDLFTALYLREPLDREKLLKLGISGDKLILAGDTKIDALLSRKNSEEALAMKYDLGLTDEDIVFTAGSLHKGEDEEIAAAFDILKKEAPKAKLVIVPRHPERTGYVVSLFDKRYKTCRMTENSKDWEVLVVDKIGVLFDLYGISYSAFVGGSMVDKGGQNILEPVAWGVPLQFGPHTEDFADASKEFLQMGIAREVNNGSELGEVWKEMLDEKTRNRFVKAGVDYMHRHSGAGEKTWKMISAYKK